MSAVLTPFLAVDPVRLVANVESMAARARAAGVGLRPHVKTHKCLEVGRLQVAAGVVGVTVATVGEAQVFVDGGFDDVFVAYPVWVDAVRGARLRHLAERARVSVGVDSVVGVEALAEHVPGVSVLVEVDSGHHRSGVVAEGAGVVARAAVEAGLDVVGVFTFPGHSYAVGGREAAARDEAVALAAAVESLRGVGVVARVVSGGSSPSLEFADTSVVTELRPGVYVTGDAQQWELGACGAGDVALTCHATVVSHAGGRLVLDAGSKVLGADRAAFASGFGRLLDHPDARVVILSEHHAVVEMPAGVALPAVGSVVRVVPNHACNAINLVDTLYVVEGGAGGDVVGAWPVAARGANA